MRASLKLRHDTGKLRHDTSVLSANSNGKPGDLFVAHNPNRERKTATLLADNLSNVGDMWLVLQCQALLSTYLGIEDITVRQWAEPSAAIRDQMEQAGLKWSRAKQIAPSFKNRDNLLVFSGGEVIRDNSSTWNVAALLATLIVNRLLSGQAIALGAGARLPSSAIHRVMWRLILGSLSFVSTRDPMSRSVLMQMKPGREVNLGHDLTFLPTALSRRMASLPLGPKLVVAPCFDRLEGRTFDREHLADTIALLVAEHRFSKVSLFAHDRRENMDIVVCRELESQLLRRKVHAHVRVDVAESVNDCFKTYDGAGLVISNRLHALLFGVIGGKPVIALDDGNPKIDAICQDLRVSRISSTCVLSTIQASQIMATEIGLREWRLGQIREMEGRMQYLLCRASLMLGQFDTHKAN